jgi:hypothetical protein
VLGIYGFMGCGQLELARASNETSRRRPASVSPFAFSTTG